MAATPPSTGGGNVLTRKFGPLPGWAWAGLAVGGYLIYRQRKAASAAAAAAAAQNSGLSATAAPGASAPSGYGYQGPSSSGSSGPGWNVGPATGSTGNATAATPSPGFGTITINGQQYVILGKAGGPVYQVGGGAPVFFGNANGVSQGAQAQAQAAANGGYAYVPIEYASLVSATPTQQPQGVLA